MTDTETNRPEIGISREKAAEPELGHKPIDGFRYTSTDLLHSNGNRCGQKFG